MGPRTRAIMGVSILGNPAALDVMRRFADERGLYFIEDNCKSMDAELGGKKAGTFGHMSTFSSFFSHHISTMEGGMVTTDDRELFELVKSMRAHGWVRDLPDDSVIFDKRGDDFYEAYRFILPGYNVRPIEMSGAIGVEQLKKLPRMTAARRKNWALFQKLFGGDNRFIIQRENGKSSAFSFTIVLNPEAELSRPKIMRALKEADIGYRIITGGCITRHDVIKHYDYECVDGLPNANLAHDQGFFVGNHPVRPDAADRTAARGARSGGPLEAIAEGLRNHGNWAIHPGDRRRRLSRLHPGAGAVGGRSQGHRARQFHVSAEQPGARSAPIPNFDVVNGDARKVETLKPLVAKADYVFPLAALVGAPLATRIRSRPPRPIATPSPPFAS